MQEFQSFLLKLVSVHYESYFAPDNDDKYINLLLRGRISRIYPKDLVTFNSFTYSCK